MRPSLAQLVLAAHRHGPERAGDRLPAPGDEIAVVPDQVLLDEESALIALHACETLGLARAATPHVFVALERDGVRAGEDVRREQRRIESVAARLGLTLARPGFGEAGAAHRGRAAIPGRLAAGPLARFGGAGAYASLLEPADPLELASVLAGEPLVTRVPHAHAVRLVGRLPSWSTGFDLAASVARSLPARAGAGVIEFVGLDLPRLPVWERLAVADALAARGCRALFPSDEATREALALEGRGTDWREFASADDGESAAILDAGVIEPQLWVAGEPAPVEARGRAGARLEGVWLGPRCGVEDVLRWLDRMDGAPRAPGTAVVLMPGTRRLLDTLAAAGALARLEAAGVEVRAAGGGEEPPARGAWLVCGGSGGWAACGPEVAAAGARLGVVADPRELDEIGAGVAVHAGGRPAPAAAPRAPEDGRLLRSGAAGTAEGTEAGEPLPLGAPLDRPLRGVLLADLERLPPEGWIRWGPRVAGDRDRPSALARHVLALEAPGFADTATAQHGGFLRVRGPVPATARLVHEAIALKSLGVHAVLATGYAAPARRAFARFGILALELPEAAPDGPGAGHELEIPDLPDGLSPRKPLVCRDLTHGRQFALRHAHEAAEIEDLVAGGRLSRLAARHAGARAGTTEDA